MNSKLTPVRKPPSARKLTKEQLTNVLLAPHVSEKSARVSAEGNQFVFRVRNDATRTMSGRGRDDVRGEGATACR